MCGIIGIHSLKYASFIMEANRQVQHRGPDADGIYQEGHLALGHQRLSILDLSSNGRQPMQSADGSLVIIFNGEIYNHLEIRKKLTGNPTFKSSSDTETLLYAYQEYGVDLFRQLNGIFAFAIYDRRQQLLILCRDQFGVKPLYYYQKGADLFFGSEIKSFLKIPGWDKSIDHAALSNYLHYLYSPSEQTPFKLVKKMPPGHFAIINLRKTAPIQFQKYYEIPFTGKYESGSEAEWIERVDTAFSKAVERQLLADVPIGFFLSGGLDSSMIVAKARTLTSKKIACYTIDTDFQEGNIEGHTNDLYYAKRVAKYLDVDLEIVPAKVDIVQDFDKMIWHLDEPLEDAAPLNVLNICNRARQKGSVVLLGGIGGDDLFSGYRRHQALNFEKFFKWTPNVIGRGIQTLAAQFSNKNATIRRIQKITKHIHQPVLDRLVGYYEWLPLEVNKSLFHQPIQKKLNGYNPTSILMNALVNIPDNQDYLNTLLFWDMKFFLADHNLNYTDKMSMAVGIEARVPFLDVELVNLSTKIPPNLKMKGSTTKYILKKVAEKYLPKEIIYRPKTGFGAPVRKWINNDLDERIHDYLSPTSIKNRGIFNAKNVTKLIADNKAGQIDASYAIWGLLAIESWMRQFSD